MQLRLIMALSAVLLVTIVALQNTEEVQTKLLFVRIAMPRAVLLFVTFAFGLLGGALGTLWWQRKHRAPPDAGSRAAS